MTTRRAFTRLAAAAALLALCALPASAADTTQSASSPSLADQVQTILDSGQMLAEIDSAYRAGALTYSEARALYAEQSAIRGTFTRLANDDRQGAARRAMFMMRTAQGTLARLRFNAQNQLQLRVSIAGL